MGSSRRSDLETCEKNSGVLDRRKRARSIVSVAMILSPSMMFRRWATHRRISQRVAELQDQQAALRQQATAPATANMGHLRPHLSFIPLIVCRYFTAHHTAQVLQWRLPGFAEKPRIGSLPRCRFCLCKELNACRSTRTSAVMAARLSLPRYIATMLAQQVIALQTELHRPKPL